MEELLIQYACACCGEMNETLVDVTAGSKQAFVEDCTVCCRPNVLTVLVDQSTGHVSLRAEFEG